MQLVIEERYCGPATSGNGGWTAGSLAAALRAAENGAPAGAAVTVRLSAPPPLMHPLDVAIAPTADGAPVATLSADGAVVATATVATGWEIAEPVPPSSVAAAEATVASYVSADEHPFPRCVVCGPARAPGDGMRLTPGRLPEGGTACVWRPADTTAHVTEPWVWAALDCPGGWASDLLGRPMVLGTMTAQVMRTPSPDQACVVTGRLDRTAGRRSWTSSAVRSAEGDLLARAEAVWVAVDAAAFDAILG